MFAEGVGETRGAVRRWLGRKSEVRWIERAGSAGVKQEQRLLLHTLDKGMRRGEVCDRRQIRRAYLARRQPLQWTLAGR